MPDKLIEQLKRAKDQVTLAEDRKAIIRARIVETIDAQMRAADALGSPVRAQSAPFRFLTRLRVVTALVAIVVLGSAGVSFAAQESLPGDVLYPVKVGVNENVQTVLAFSSEAKAEVAIEHAESRLDEISSLSAQGRLDEDTASHLRATFEKQSDVAQVHIEKLHEEEKLQEAADAAVRFEGALRAQRAVLASVESDKHTENADDDYSDSGREAANFDTSIRGRIGVLAALRARLESHVGDDASSSSTTAVASVAEARARAQVSVALKVIASATAFVQAEGVKDGGVSPRAEAQAAAAAALAAEAQTKLDAGSFGEAFTLSNRAIGTAAEARSLATASAHLNGRAKKDGALDFLFRGGHEGERNKPSITPTPTNSSAVPKPIPTPTDTLHASSSVKTDTKTEDHKDNDDHHSGEDQLSGGSAHDSGGGSLNVPSGGSESGILHALGF